MTEFAFFDSKEERWGEKMRAIWGNLSICPHLDSLELPCHTLGELQSISWLKIWGITQEPCNDMAYLLVHTEGDSEAKSYSMALVWTSPHQAWVSMMEEASGALSTCTSSGPDWPYVSAQLYKGSNHTSLPKDKHLGILLWGKVEESHMGRSSNLKSTRYYPPGHKLSIQKAWMGVTSQLPLTYWNCCTAALVSLLMNTPICKLTFHYLLLRSQSTQLCHLVEHLLLQQTTYLKLSGNPGSPWWQRLMT